MKKLTFLMLAVLVLTPCAILASTDKTIEELHAEIQNLNRQISNLTNTVESQKMEIERLKNLCLTNGINISPKENIDKPTQGAISQSMFKIFLGESLDSLKKRFNVHKSTFAYEDDDHPGEIWSVQNDNANVKHLLVETFNDNIYHITVHFVDGSKTNYETINNQLKKKYKSEDEGGFSGALFGEGVFTPVIDGVEIRIKLNHDIGFMEGDKLELSYTHTLLSQKVYNEIKRRKALKISDDL